MTAPSRATGDRGATAIAVPDDVDLWEVAPATWCLRMHVDLPVKYTHCYVVVDEGQAIVIDPGWDSEGALDRIVAALDEMGPGLHGLRGVVATHAHRDHVGLAHALAERAGADVWVGMHAAEMDDHRGAETKHAWRDRERRWLDALGVPDSARDETLIPEEGVESILRTTRADRALEDGDRLRVGARALEVVHTPGHSPGSMCLVDASVGVVFTGDTLLPRISPNVGWTPHGDPDPLGDYLASLTTLSSLDGLVALPGHEWPFTDIGRRTAYLHDHHAERENEVLDLLTAGDTAWSPAQRLTWSRPWHELVGFQKRVAAGETAAHLRHLLLRGRIRAVGDRSYEHVGIVATS